MQFTTVFLSALVSVASLAAPAERRADAISMMAQETTWIITNMQRTVDPNDTVATWKFGINNGKANTPCTLVAKGTPATRAPGGPVTCGPYTVTSGWSGEFGTGNGFTTLSVVDYAAGLIVFPAYTDRSVKDGKVVTPDHSYTPSKLS